MSYINQNQNNELSYKKILSILFRKRDGCINCGKTDCAYVNVYYENEMKKITKYTWQLICNNEATKRDIKSRRLSYIFSKREYGSAANDFYLFLSKLPTDVTSIDVSFFKSHKSRPRIDSSIVFEKFCSYCNHKIYDKRIYKEKYIDSYHRKLK